MKNDQLTAAVNIRDYLKHQRRFRHLSDDIINQIQDWVKEHFEVAKQKCGIE